MQCIDLMLTQSGGQWQASKRTYSTTTRYDMAQAAPLGEAEPEKLDFEYDVAPEYVNAIIDETGLRPPARWSISIDLSEDVNDPSLRRRLRAAYDFYAEAPGYPELPAPTDDPIEFLVQLDLWQAAISDDDDEGSDRSHSEAFVAEMRAWTFSYGSRRLKKAVERDYKAISLYAQERVDLEVPGAWVDTADDADLRERTDPSEEALDFEGQVESHLGRMGSSHSPRIVWMVEPPRELAKMLEAGSMIWEPDEALAIYGYLSRYTLVLPLDQDCRRPVAVVR
jgi:hypothetical protein